MMYIIVLYNGPEWPDLASSWPQKPFSLNCQNPFCIMSLFGISLLGMDSRHYLDLDCIQTLSKQPPRPRNGAWAANRPIEQAGSQSDNQATPRQEHQIQSANREIIKPNWAIGQSGIRALNRPVGQNSGNRVHLPNQAIGRNRPIGQ